ncbi:branched-chain amino acid ABC transporter permease [Pusillimonas caeni]|uniref:branched-chain amino acid ABC transporter permease n=1 Tax=Pusillimonas caeni TaxID=1348472 RepID=UPI000E59B79F|nr:branched-chain amino acid ABC transporter permease [Pusillimonas caeni]TFL13118.1 branched-chain amino acid ABC transporter permease [Pusillimonas caeni]
MTKPYLLLALLVVALLALLPEVGNNYVLRIGAMMLMYMSLALAWNFIGGFAGYPSFGTAGFFGLGAYVSALLQAQGLPAQISWVFAAAVGGVFALLLGVILLRLRGHAFAIATLVVAEVLREIINAWTSLTGGGMGLNLAYSGLSPEVAARYYYHCMLVLAVLAFIATVVVAGNKLGFGLRCIKQNEGAANMVGVNATLYKAAAFALSGVFIAAAGGIYASWTGYIEPADVFDIMISIKAIVMVLLGGVGTILGPVIGALAFLVLDEIVWRNLLKLHTGTLGLLIVLLVLFLPMGLYSLRPRHRNAAKVKA